MKGVILRKGETAYSCLSGAFSAIQPAVTEHNWLITDYENVPELWNRIAGIKAGRLSSGCRGNGLMRLSISRVFRGTGVSCRDLRERYHCRRY